MFRNSRTRKPMFRSPERFTIVHRKRAMAMAFFGSKPQGGVVGGTLLLLGVGD